MKKMDLARLTPLPLSYFFLLKEGTLEAAGRISFYMNQLSATKNIRLRTLRRDRQNNSKELNCPVLQLGEMDNKQVLGFQPLRKLGG